MPDAASLEPSDPRSLGQYQLLGRLGAGGQGAVYLGQNQAGDKVAIKLLHAQYAADPSARARFTREVAAAQKVEAFCTARVIEADLQGGQPYVVSEYIDGPSLHDVVVSAGPRGRDELDKLAIGTVTALAAIHEAGIVHRDFKPNNVMLAADGPRVVDFGIARTVNSQESKVTATGMVVGTPGYLAPEQLTGAPLMPSVDIFAWAATMVFAATGQSPFEADTLPVVINRILNDEPDLSALHEPLRSVVAQCLAKDAAQRPAATQLLLRLLNNAGASPAGGTGDALLAQGTQLAAQLPAPPALDRTAMAPPVLRPNTPPPMQQPGAGPMTPTPMYGQGMMPPPQGPMTPPPSPGYGTPPQYGQPTMPGYGPQYGQQQQGFGQPGYPPQPGYGQQPPGFAPAGYPMGPPPRKSNTGLIVGIIGGAVAVVVAIVVVAVVVSSSGGSGKNDAGGGGGGGGTTTAPTASATASGGGDGGGSGTSPFASMTTATEFDDSYDGEWDGTVAGSAGEAGAEVSLYPLIGKGLGEYHLNDGTTCYTQSVVARTGSGSSVAMHETGESSSSETDCAAWSDSYEYLTMFDGTVHYALYKSLTDTAPVLQGTLTKKVD